MSDTEIISMPSTLESRRHQVNPVLTEQEIKRLHRFGTVRSYARGVRILEAGHTCFGMLVGLKGSITICKYDGLGNSEFLTNHGPGEITAEVSQLSGRPSMVNATAADEVEVLEVSPENLRALVIAEAELGER